MKCYKCGSFLYENDYCAECGADVSRYKRIVKKSNELYNRGLRLARDRNLTGAIEALRVSVRMYKANISARNLLGLVYIEIGEYTMGLAQWVISKSFQSENNMADHFLEKLQNSRQDLNLMNSTIRKYNKALNYVKQGNYDLAEIQLKKLLNDNENLVKGHQLLALLFIRKKKYAEARNALKKAQRIDRGDPLTISYMTMVDEEIREAEEDMSPTEVRNRRISEKAEENADHTPLSGDDVIIPKSSYSEYNPATMTILQILIGAVIGAAIIFFVVMPAKSRSIRGEFAAEIASQSARIEELEKASEEALIEEETETPVPEDPSYENLVNAQMSVDAGNYTEALEYLNKVDKTKLSSRHKTYYEQTLEYVNSVITTDLVNAGLYYYSEGQWQEAVNSLKQAYEMDVRSAALLYYLGRSYDQLSDENNTLRYLREFVSEYPDDENVEVANQIINGWTN